MIKKAKDKRTEFRIKYTLSNRSGEITYSALPNKAFDLLFKNLVTALALREREGVELSLRQFRSIENLPPKFFDKLVNHGLVEGKPEAKNPTVEQLVKRFKDNRHDVKELTRTTEKAALENIVEFLGASTRVSEVVPEKCEGFVHWLITNKSLSKATANRRLGKLKQVFERAVKWRYIAVSPADHLIEERAVNQERQEFIELDRFMPMVHALTHPELKLIVILAYHGFRIPSEIRFFRTTDIEVVTIKGKQYQVLHIADKDKGTKTGTRPVLFLPMFQSYLDVVLSAVKPGREYVFDAYRTYSNLWEAVYRDLQRSGFVKKGDKLWEKFFVNLRATVTTSWDNAGLPDSLQDIQFGNSVKIRKGHYKLGLKGFKSTDAFVEKMLEYLPDELTGESVPSDFPTQIPTFSRLDLSFWEKIDDTTPNIEIALALCKANGLPDDLSRCSLAQDGRLDVFGNAVKSIRHSVYAYSQGKISHVRMIGHAFGFVIRAGYEFLREVVFSPFRREPNLAEAGLEPA